MRGLGTGDINEGGGGYGYVMIVRFVMRDNHNRVSCCNCGLATVMVMTMVSVVVGGVIRG